MHVRLSHPDEATPRVRTSDICFVVVLYIDGTNRHGIPCIYLALAIINVKLKKNTPYTVEENRSTFTRLFIYRKLIKRKLRFQTESEKNALNKSRKQQNLVIY